MFSGRNGVESVLFLPELFGRCTVFSSLMKIQISSSFRSLMNQLLCPLYCFPFSSLFSIFYIFFFSDIIGIKHDYDHLTCAQFPLLSVARLPVCSHEHPPLLLGSICVLNLMYRLQHTSHALTSYVDIYVYVCRAHL